MPSDEPRRGRAHEEGNTLVLMPVAVLVLLVLASIAFDAANVYLQQRRLADLAAGLANDAVAGLDLDAVFDAGQEARIDPGRARGLTQARLGAFTRDRTLEDVRCVPAIDGFEVTVACEGRVAAVFGRALAGDGFAVRAVESARAAVE
ncbi:hypothetical protein [Egicoccus sp. AB-alg2]|uniref:hypothetical protein n=1 Tax=Egicoccus sp. AB-alg2 TaxID=3242693 RepID=UPI00359E84AA